MKVSARCRPRREAHTKRVYEKAFFLFILYINTCTFLFTKYAFGCIFLFLFCFNKKYNVYSVRTHTHTHICTRPRTHPYIFIYVHLQIKFFYCTRNARSYRYFIITRLYRNETIRVKVQIYTQFIQCVLQAK